MSVQFILGRSGSGKTSYCIKAVVEALLDRSDDRPLILLVPEQASYQAEQAILNDKRIGGYNRLNVLSFDRLGFMLLGKHVASQNLSRIGRQMVIQRLLRVNKDKLKVFSTTASHIGTATAIAETISELQQQGKSSEDIDEFAAILKKYDPNSLTAKKFVDIALIFKEYTDFIKDKFTDADTQLTLARKAVAESNIIKGARLWVDGFSGFTTSEFEMLAEMMRTANQVNIALCLDPAVTDVTNTDKSKVDKSSMFGPTEITYCELLDIAKKNKVNIDKPILLNEPGRFINCNALDHVEKEFAKLEPVITDSSGGAIRIVAAGDNRSESKFVTSEIKRLVRVEGYRYRDIAVIASDIDSYEHYLRAYLDDHLIPFFLDKRKKLSEHPVIELVLSALSIVSDGFTLAEVFAYLKTGLVRVAKYDIDYLENYCIAFGIGPDDWSDEGKWQYAAKDHKRFDNINADNIRKNISKPIFNFINQLCGGETSLEIDHVSFTKAIFGLLEELGVQEKVNSWVEDAIASGDSEQASRHQQFWDKFTEIFDELAESFEDIEMPCGQWADIIKNAFSQMTLVFIPPRLDQVLVGSIERSRHPNLKAVFLLGCTQKLFPSPVTYDKVLSESDRMATENQNFELGNSAKDDLNQREYLAYIAFTRPSEYLCVSYPVADDKGNTNVISQYVERLAGLIEDVEIEQLQSSEIDIGNVTTENELAELLCERLGSDPAGQVDDKLKSLAKELETNEKNSCIIEYALNYDNSSAIDVEISKSIFGKQFKCSATKLSTYSACPYQYFSKYILRLKEKEEFTFEPLDKGQFYHNVLDAFTKELLKKQLDIGDTGIEKLLEILRQQIAVLFKQDSFIEHFNSHSKHNAYVLKQMCENLEELVIAMQRMICAGRFRPIASEACFGKTEDMLGECKMSVGKTDVILKGKVDRLDIAEVDGIKYSLVFDYKLSGKRFNYTKFYHGLDMQLPIYLLAVSGSQYKPIGAFFIPIESSVKRAEYSKVDNGKDIFRHKAYGLLNGEYFESLDKSEKGAGYYNISVTQKDAQYGRYATSGALRPDDYDKVIELAKANIASIVKSILSGDIDVKPYRWGTQIPCGYCPYKPVCRFDWQINDYRSIETVSKLDVLKMAGGK